MSFIFLGVFRGMGGVYGVCFMGLENCGELEYWACAGSEKRRNTYRYGTLLKKLVIAEDPRHV